MDQPAPRFNDLLRAIRESYPTAYVPIPDPKLTIPTTWPFPSFFEDRSLNGVSLVPFVRVKATMPYGEMLGVFAQYAHHYLAGIDRPPDAAGKWLGRQFRLHTRKEMWLFNSRNCRRPQYLQHYLATMMWLMSNHPDCPYPLECEGNTILLGTTKGNKIGVENGRLLARFTDIELPPFDYLKALQTNHELTPQVSKDRHLSLHYRHAMSIQDHELRDTVRSALRILHFGYGHLARLGEQLGGYFVPQEKRRWGVRPHLKRLVACFTDMPNPMPYLHQEMVPNMVTEEEFQTEFAPVIHLLKEAEGFMAPAPDLITLNNTLRKLAGREPYKEEE